jgi:ATP-dependent HslUV protease, peptidase subunit HslV
LQASGRFKGQEKRVMGLKQDRIHGTTILAVRRDGRTAIGGDGQVTLGQTALKHDANKIRRLSSGKVLCGFAGSAADAFALLEKFEAKLEEYKGNLKRAATQLAKDWRTDRVLRRLESLLAAVDSDTSLIISGDGNVIEPTDGVIGIGSGGMFAAAAARALLKHSSLPAEQIVREAMLIAADICVYTNDKLTIETL